MNEKIGSIIITSVMAFLLFGTAVWCWLRTPDKYSSSERRELAAFPELNAGAIADGSFMKNFEEYTADQFPLRDTFRGIKAFTEFNVMQKLDNNGLYTKNGFISEIQHPINDEMLTHAVEKFRYIYDTYLAENDMKIYLSVVPDKNYYLAEESGRLLMDYDKLIARIREQTEYMDYIDITNTLDSEDYYRTDTHWRQENIIDTAQYIAKKMGVSISDDFVINELDSDFCGVYSGQLALPTEPDVLRYLTNDAIDGCTVTSYSTGSPVQSVVYSMDKASGRDPYEIFLSGSEPLIVIENPACETDKRLIMFRDSFGSSLAPLLIEGYSEITIVDIRYIQSSVLGSFIDFDDQDVLFIYSTLLLNNSLSLR